MEEKKPVVFVPNKGFHDFTAAEKFGELIFLSSDPSGISQFHTSRMARLFKPYIEASTKDDYILVTSLTVMVSVLSGMFAFKHGRLNLLLYRPKKDDYEVRRIVFSNVDDIEDVNDFEEIEDEERQSVLGIDEVEEVEDEED